MSRRLGGAVVIAILIATVGLPAFGSTRTYADDFSSGGYDGSTGSANWETSWREIGEDNGPSSGSVTVDTGSLCDSSDCLTIKALLGTSLGAWRRIDMTGASNATLSYYVDFPPNLLGGSALVAVRADEGRWTTLESHKKGTRDSFQHNLPPADTSLDIRFTAAGLALGTEMGFDSVVVRVEVPVTTTTTTTSTTTSSTTTARPIITIPTTVTLPPILTTTTSTTTPDDRPPDDTATTTTTTVASTTSTTRSDAGGPTTTTTPPQTSNSTTTIPAAPTGTSTPPAAPPGEGTSEPPPPPPSETFGVITRLDPGVILGSELNLQAQDRLVVRFVRASEKISFDILLNLALGIILAWASLSTMQRKSG